MRFGLAVAPSGAIGASLAHALAMVAVTTTDKTPIHRNTVCFMFVLLYVRPGRLTVDASAFAMIVAIDSY
jgi:hypothetical protein